MNVRRVDSVPHDVEPAFGRNHAKDGEHRREHMVKVAVLVDPVASVVQAVPLGDDVLDCVLRHVCRVTVVKSALQQANCLDAEDEEYEC